MKKKLVVGDNIVSKRGSWSFSNSVAKNFVDHAKKSIMGYEEGHDLVCKISDFFCSKGGIVVDIGVSTGELLKKLINHNSHKEKIKYFGIDIEKPMIDKAKSYIGKKKNLKLINKDIILYDLPKNDFLISYYTIQFIHPKFRQRVFDKIYDSLNWGGGFIFFEKVRGPDARFQDMISNIYNNFKIEKGFSSNEILAKAEGIKGVLEPFSSEGNLGLLKRAGFQDIMTIYKNVCFEGVLCIK